MCVDEVNPTGDNVILESSRQDFAKGRTRTIASLSDVVGMISTEWTYKERTVLLKGPCQVRWGARSAEPSGDGHGGFNCGSLHILETGWMKYLSPIARDASAAGSASHGSMRRDGRAVGRNQ